ncbi:MAG: hypothetical protein QOF86_2315 [Baekduia sp.]|jgi:hypothetical protein|nr:hypothetical protein [Baekduia sp.]
MHAMTRRTGRTTTIVAALAALAVLVPGIAPAGAVTIPSGGFALPLGLLSSGATPAFGAVPVATDPNGVSQGACNTQIGAEGQGPPGSIEDKVCMGAGLSFIGPSIGQIASVVGPTTIGPAFIGTSVASAGGNVVIGPTP